MSNTEIKSDYEILTDALDLSELPVEEQEELLIDLQELVKKGVLLRVLEQMDEKTKDEFSAFMDTFPEEDAVMDFIESHVSNTDEIVQETLKELADDILSVSKE